jgi:hypothetical protein
MLSAASSSWCGMQMIIFNMAGYTSRVEAEDMINVQRDDFIRNLGILRDVKARDFMDSA